MDKERKGIPALKQLYRGTEVGDPVIGIMVKNPVCTALGLFVHWPHSHLLSTYRAPCCVLGKVVTMWSKTDMICALKDLSFYWGRKMH